MLKLLSQPRRWMPYRWVLVAASVLVTIGMGYTGFTEHFDKTGEEKSIPDVIYLTLQLFTMDSGDVAGPMPGTLDLARFLGPLVSAYTVVNAIVGLFSTQIHKLWIWLVGGHVVVCGLGRKGVRLVEQLRSAGRQVVVIEPDEQNPHLTHCQELGCYLVKGRANDPWSLGEAYVRRARLLVAVAGDDGVNIETAVRAHDLVQNRRGRSLQCVAHVSDPNLQNVFRRHHVFTASDDPFDLELFNTYEMAARVMLREAGAMRAAPASAQAPQHVVIVGAGHLGETVLLRLLKDWHFDPPADRAALRATVIDMAADERRRHFARRYPELLAAAGVEFLPIDIRDADLAEGSYLAAGAAPPAAVFVCLDDDSQAMYAALKMRSHFPETPIIVRMTEEAGLATVLGLTFQDDGAVPGVLAIGMLDTACSLDLVLGGTREILAQAIHQGYVADQIAAGHSLPGNAAMAPWHRLPEALRESNRQQADHIRDKLQLVGCDLVPQPGNPVALFEFTTAEVELLARVEHERWLDERRAAGWKLGPAKDVDRKISPFLLPWAKLPDDAKAYNRDAIRRIPRVLAKADFAVSRIASETPEAQTIAPPAIQPRRRPRTAQAA